MTSPKQVLKSVGPKLVPFFKTVAIYFVVFIPCERPSMLSMVLKCLPIISLLFFVLMHGMSLGNEHAFSRKILIGMIFSCIGDALLIWPHTFLHGMAAFGVGHLFYIAAFGFKPLNMPLGMLMYALGALGLSVWLPKLSVVYLIGVPIYTTLLMTMVWRAMARVQIFQELWTWTKLCSCVGGVLFAISDAFIGFDRFHSSIPYRQVLIMTTYYAAQLGIALSVVDSKASYIRDQEEQEKRLRLKSIQLTADAKESIHVPAAGEGVSSTVRRSRLSAN